MISHAGAAAFLAIGIQIAKAATEIEQILAGKIPAGEKYVVPQTMLSLGPTQSAGVVAEFPQPLIIAGQGFALFLAVHVSPRSTRRNRCRLAHNHCRNRAENSCPRNP